MKNFTPIILAWILLISTNSCDTFSSGVKIELIENSTPPSTQSTSPRASRTPRTSITPNTAAEPNLADEPNGNPAQSEEPGMLNTSEPTESPNPSNTPKTAKNEQLESDNEDYYADFFDDLDYFYKFLEYNDSFQFDKIKELTDLYIKETSPKKTDTVYKIQQILKNSKAVSLMSTCTILDYDLDFPEKPMDYEDGVLIEDEISFEDEMPLNEIAQYSYIYPKGAKPISASTNITSFFDEGVSYYRIGYTSNGRNPFSCTNIELWADGKLIDEMSPSYDSSGEEHTLKRFIVFTDSPINDNDGSEDDEYSDEIVDMILASKKVVVRFINTDDDKSMNHTMSKQEKDALKTIYTLNIVRKKLSNIHPS